MTKISPCADLYLQSSAHVFTTFGIYGMFTVTLIWIVQNYLQMLLYLVTPIIAIPFCLVLQTLASPNFNVFRINWPTLGWSHLPFLVLFHCCIPFIGNQLKFGVDSKICLLTYMTLREKQPVYLHSMLATSLPSRSLRSKKEITVFVPWVNTITGMRAFHSCAPSLWNNLPLSVCSATSTEI